MLELYLVEHQVIKATGYDSHMNACSICLLSSAKISPSSANVDNEEFVVVFNGASSGINNGGIKNPNATPI
ncbi:hypothetical protein DERF_013607 [Dermatophagoides farinae]|uniref:Uncharacterized protein n=1 Tax=Dermatophagoides farinae TaxID=6954 RepID=A0A922HRX7_DERFA|nr:hypothetical protein DERF_013607 [Dermatophagoides farinae]